MISLDPTIPKQTMGSSLRRYLTIYAALWKNSVVREMGFKSNFLLWIVVEMLWFALQISFIAVIYRHTESIGTWSKYQVILLVGASHFIQQLFSALFLTNCVQLSENVRTGKLDFMLLLPVNTRFLISLRTVDLGGFINAGSAVAVMLYAGKQLGLSVGIVQVISFLAFALASIIIHYSLMLTLSSASFYTVRAQGIVWGYYNLFNISRLPDAAFRGFFKLFFKFVLPMLLVANVPAKVVLGTLTSAFDATMLLFMAAVCFGFSEWVWRRSLKRYTSASS